MMIYKKKKMEHPTSFYFFSQVRIQESLLFQLFIMKLNQEENCILE